jgi:hypothetical protein
MNAEQLVGRKLGGETELLCPPQMPPNLESNPGRSGGKLVTNRLGHCTTSPPHSTVLASWQKDFRSRAHQHYSTVHRHPWADCLENVGTSTSHNHMGLHGLLQGQIYLYWRHRRSSGTHQCFCTDAMTVALPEPTSILPFYLCQDTALSIIKNRFINTVNYFQKCGIIKNRIYPISFNGSNWTCVSPPSHPRTETSSFRNTVFCSEHLTQNFESHASVKEQLNL